MGGQKSREQRRKGEEKEGEGWKDSCSRQLRIAGLIGVALVAALGSAARDHLALKSASTWVKKYNLLFSQVTGASRMIEIMTFVFRMLVQN